GIVWLAMAWAMQRFQALRCPDETFYSASNQLATALQVVPLFFPALGVGFLLASRVSEGFGFHPSGTRRPEGRHREPERKRGRGDPERRGGSRRSGSPRRFAARDAGWTAPDGIRCAKLWVLIPSEETVRHDR